MEEIRAFEHMMEAGMYEYHCDPWYAAPGVDNYRSVQYLTGQLRYKGEIFVVFHKYGRHGSGGMDEGSPASVSIIRIAQEGGA